MLTNLKESEFEKYAPLAWSLAQDLRTSGYPTYMDGIKTREEFFDRSRCAFTRENEEILLYLQDGRVLGWIHYSRLPEDRYLQTCSFCIAQGMGDAIKEFIAFAKGRFPGNTLYLGFPRENTEAVAALTRGGYERIEECFNDVMDLSGYDPTPDCPDIVPVTRANYGPFRALHDRNTDMYWSSERLLADIDDWAIYLYERGDAVAGAVYFRRDPDLSEIFGVDFPGEYDPEAYRLLVTAALNEAKRDRVRFMCFFNGSAEQPDALSLGFRCVSGYVCYKIGL